VNRPTIFFLRPAAPAAVLLALTVALGGCSSSNSGSGGAQGGNGASAFGSGSPTQGRRRMAQALMSLGLSDAQKSQIRGIMSAVRAQNANADPATRRANYMAAMAKVDAVLTPAQRTALHAKLDKWRKARAAGAAAQS